MNASVGEEAERELIEGAIYYAREGGKELGQAFIAEFERVVSLLCAHPELGARSKNRRRFPLRRFPFSVVYYERGNELRVVALGHHARPPDYWADRT